MTSPGPTRPPRVTTACLYIGLSCALLVFFAGSWISGWGSLETQQQVKSLGLDADVANDWYRPVLVTIAAFAAAGVVFAVYAARGHEPSRWILTVLCVLVGGASLFLSPWGIFVGVFAIFCATYLWTYEARHWFAVVNGKTPPVAPEPRTPAKVADPTPATASGEPAQGPYLSKKNRPDVVLVATLIAIIMSSIVVIACGLYSIVYLVAREDYVKLLKENATVADALADSGLTVDGFAFGVFVASVIATVLAVGAVAAAGAALAGRSGGHTLLVILSAISIPLTLFAMPFGLVWMGAAIATLVLLRRPEARSWFARS